MARVRSSFGAYLHALVAQHAQEHSARVTADPEQGASHAVKARHQEADVLELFLKENPVASLLTPEERHAALSHILYLRSSTPPAYLGGKIRVDAEAALILEDAMIAAGMKLGDPTPWGPATLEARLLALGFPRAIQVEEG
jgi:hypothetical protein